MVGKEQSNVFEKDCDVILWDTNAAGFLLFAMVSNSNVSIKSREIYIMWSSGIMLVSKYITNFIIRTECRSSMENYAEAIKSLDNNLRNYDARNLPRPNSGNGNITITTNMYIRAIPKFDEINSV